MIMVLWYMTVKMFTTVCDFFFIYYDIMTYLFFVPIVIVMHGKFWEKNIGAYIVYKSRIE